MDSTTIVTRANDGSPVAESKTYQQLAQEGGMPIGGLLYLIGIGVFFLPIRLAISVYSEIWPTFTDGTWQILTTPTGQLYSPYWGPLLITEFTVNLLLVAASIWMLYLFVTKKRQFPNWYVGFITFNVAFITIDAYVVTLLIPENPIFDKETMRALLQSLFALGLWGTYLKISNRSKATFIH